MNKSNTPNKPNYKIIGIALACFLLLVLALGNTVLTSFETKVSYPNFISQVEKHQVKECNVNVDTGKVTYERVNSNKSFYTNYPYSEKFVETLLNKGVDVKIHEVNWLVSVLKYGGPTIILLLFFLLIIKAQGSLDFSVEPVANLKTRFKDIAGMAEIKEDLLVLSEMMKDPAYRESGARIPRGVLLQGPPGNGKTLLARAFAGETGVNFIAVNACDFGSQFVGVGSNKINKVFDAAKKSAPCVIFIDEIDSVGAKRATSSDAAGKEMNTMLTALLNQMDGFEQMDNVMVLAATNRVQDLDDALIRPGRFDRQFVVDYPDKKTRKEIFELYSKDIILDDEIDFSALAQRTYGYSCSRIECVVNEAVINSIKRRSPVVALEDFEEAILQMNIKGRLKKEYKQSDKERKIIAYHEAGHAVLAYFLTDKKVTHISVIPTTSGAGGFTITEDPEDLLQSLDSYKNEMKMMYGGRAGEVILGGNLSKATAGAAMDIKQVTALASSYVNIEKGMDYSAFGSCGIEKNMSITEDILKDIWDSALYTAKEKSEYIKAIGEYLLENEVMSGEKFIEVIKEVEETSNGSENLE